MLTTATRAVATASLAAVLGCSLEGEPDDQFFFTGLVTDPAGARRPGATAVLSRSRVRGRGCPEGLHVAADGFFGEYLAADGAYRPFADAGSPFVPYTSAVTDDRGKYIVPLLRYEIAPPDQTFASSTFCLAMSASGGDGASATAWLNSSFNGGVADGLYPDLALWEGVQLSTATTAAGVEVAAPALPWEPSPLDGGMSWQDFPFGGSAYVGAARYYEWQVGQGELPAWRERTLGAPLVMSAALLEDFGGLHVWLESQHAERQINFAPSLLGSAGVAFRTIEQTAAQPIASGAAAPRSRGCACSSGDAGWVGCPLTDGQLALVGASAGADPWRSSDLWSIDLGAPARPALAVVRDLQPSWIAWQSGVLVQGSADGGGWRWLGEAVPAHPYYDDGGSVFDYQGPASGSYELMSVGAFLQITLDAGSQPVRYVRFTPADGQSVFGAIREISIFE